MASNEVEIKLKVTGQPEVEAGITRTSEVVKSASKQISASMDETTAKTSAVNRAFFSVSSGSEGLSERIKALSSGFKAAGLTVDEIRSRMDALKSELVSVGLPAKELDSLFKNLHDSGSRVEDVFKGALAANLVASGFAAATEAIKGFISGSIQSVITMQQIEQSLQYASGSAEKGAQTFGYLRSEAYRLGLNLPIVATEFGRLAAATKGTSIEGGETLKIFTGLSEASVVMHLSAEQAGGAIKALQDMMSKGKVEAQELNLQLGNVLPGAMDHAANAMGVTKAELLKMMAAGKLLSEDFLPKFGEELHKAFGTQAEEASKLGLSSIQRFKTALFELSEKFGTGFLSGLMVAMDKVRETFQNEEFQNRIKSFGEILGKAISGVANHFDGLVTAAEAFFAAFAVTKIMGIVTAIESMGTALVAVVAMNPILAAIAITVGIGVVAFKEASSASHAWHDEIIRGEAELKKYGDLADPLTEKVKKLHAAFGQGSPMLMLQPASPLKKKEDPLSKEDQTELTRLQHEAIKSELEATQDGFELKKSLEEAQHKWELEKYAGKNALIEAENKRHHSEMEKIEVDRIGHENEILNKELDQKRKLKQEFATKEFKIMERDQKAETQMINEENKKKLALEDEATKRTMALDKQISHSKMALASELVGAFGKMTGLAKAAFLAQKGIAAATIVIDNLQAQAAALAPPPIGLGPILGATLIPGLNVLMALQLATVAAQSVQGFADGGIVQGPYSTGDRIPVRVNAKEMILTESQQANLFAMINQGGGDNGGSVNVTYSPTIHAGSGANADSIISVLRENKVELGRFIEKELRPKGYVR